MVLSDLPADKLLTVQHPLRSTALVRHLVNLDNSRSTVSHSRAPMVSRRNHLRTANNRLSTALHPVFHPDPEVLLRLNTVSSLVSMVNSQDRVKLVNMANNRDMVKPASTVNSHKDSTAYNKDNTASSRVNMVSSRASMVNSNPVSTANRVNKASTATSQDKGSTALQAVSLLLRDLEALMRDTSPACCSSVSRM